eukprot:NODE_735_length_2139_cov_102.167659_g701_i0.p1 GENE.NODE_735_length_2139_cov_102.167659_g701_i0~~NODE_735_length_2139_cov_102.167659_g701_i0.p1  ORF type:complete len:660 (-),score=149.11 NODE_735_length_2139_cov_102.167659_g701_i0:159-2078(-)
MAEANQSWKDRTIYLDADAAGIPEELRDVWDDPVNLDDLPELPELPDFDIPDGDFDLSALMGGMMHGMPPKTGDGKKKGGNVMQNDIGPAPPPRRKKKDKKDKIAAAAPTTEPSPPVAADVVATPPVATATVTTVLTEAVGETAPALPKEPPVCMEPVSDITSSAQAPQSTPEQGGAQGEGAAAGDDDDEGMDEVEYFSSLLEEGALVLVPSNYDLQNTRLHHLAKRTADARETITYHPIKDHLTEDLFEARALVASVFTAVGPPACEPPLGSVVDDGITIAQEMDVETILATAKREAAAKATNQADSSSSSSIPDADVFKEQATPEALQDLMEAVLNASHDPERFGDEPSTELYLRVVGFWARHADVTSTICNGLRFGDPGDLIASHVRKAIEEKAFSFSIIGPLVDNRSDLKVDDLSPEIRALLCSMLRHRYDVCIIMREVAMQVCATAPFTDDDRLWIDEEFLPSVKRVGDVALAAQFEWALLQWCSSRIAREIADTYRKGIAAERVICCRVPEILVLHVLVQLTLLNEPWSVQTINCFEALCALCRLLHHLPVLRRVEAFKGYHDMLQSVCTMETGQVLLYQLNEALSGRNDPENEKEIEGIEQELERLEGYVQQCLSTFPDDEDEDQENVAEVD